jgi:hypothetical protein
MMKGFYMNRTCLKFHFNNLRNVNLKHGKLHSTDGLKTCNLSAYMKTILKFKCLIFIGVAYLSLFASCQKFVDINEDPINSVVPEITLLLPATQLSIVGNYDDINRGASAVAQYLAGGSLNRYNQTGSTFEDSWIGYYTEVLPDLETIIANGTNNQQWGYVSIAKLEKAYLYSLMVDLWGNIPFSQVGIDPNPVFEDGEAIYGSVLSLIDEALADMEKDFTVSASADLFYQGNKLKWQRMANSLKLKLYNQTRLVNPERSKTEIMALIAGNNFMQSNEDDFTFQFGTNQAPNARHPFYVTGYSPGRDTYQSMVVVDRLKAQDDPRLRYYIFRMSANAGIGNSTSGDGYYCRYPGDGLSSPADQSTRAITGLYPSAGLYDNGVITTLMTDNTLLNNEGAAEGATGNSFFPPLFANGDGTGAGVQPLITYSMINFIRAETALMLHTGDDAKVFLLKGVEAQLMSINSLAIANQAQAIPQATISTFLARLSEEFDTASEQGKMELLMMQKWIAQYGNGVESYTDYRRTGLPALVGLVSPLDSFPLRFFYSETEMTSNESVLDNRETIQRNQQITPVFWDR